MIICDYTLTAQAQLIAPLVSCMLLHHIDKKVRGLITLTTGYKEAVLTSKHKVIDSGDTVNCVNGH